MAVRVISCIREIKEELLFTSSERIKVDLATLPWLRDAEGHRSLRNLVKKFELAVRWLNISEDYFASVLGCYQEVIRLKVILLVLLNRLTKLLW